MAVGGEPMPHWPYIINATKIRQFMACERLPFMDEHRDPADAHEPKQLLEHDLGVRHERGVGKDMRAGRYGTELAQPVVVGATGPEAFKRTSAREAFVETLALMRQGAPSIEQGVIADADWWGRPDWLHRRPGRSLLGDWFYEPADAKVAGRKTPERMQTLPVAFYALLLERIQGVRPPTFTIYRRMPGAKGPYEDGEPTREISLDTTAHVADVDDVVAGLRTVLDGDRDPGPLLTSECVKCKWQRACTADAHQRRDLSLITGMRRDVRPGLERLGIRTIDDLAGASVGTLTTVPHVSAAWADRAVEQARSYCDGRHDGRPRLSGTPELPPPSRTEVYLDIEGQGLDNATDAILFGLLIRRGSRATYWKTLADSPGDRRRAWRALCAKLRALPAEAAIFHFGNYDAQLVRGMHARHRGARGIIPRLVDVHARIERYIVMPARGTGIRPLAEALGFRRASPSPSGQMAPSWWEAWTTRRDREARANLVQHNEDDLRAMAVVMDWLRGATAAMSSPPVKTGSKSGGVRSRVTSTSSPPRGAERSRR